jgi:wyosine [tRNA(Phe)-imidazoG37] synthetase (radical SAM superfamily)
LFQLHPRSFPASRFVYPVLSRRSGGMSIGVNLNPEKSCNFACVYCQVDRTAPSGPPLAQDDLPQVARELDSLVDEVVSGRIFQAKQFAETPAPLRRLNDIAASGDGEPTACPWFADVMEICGEVRRRRKLADVKLVLITNATLLDRAEVRRGLAVLDANNGEIWGKLDAGTEAYYRRVDRAKVPLARVLENLAAAARARPIVLQSLFMRLEGEPPPLAEQEAYCDRIAAITAAGGRIKLIQVHSIARRPAESWVTPLADAELDAVAELVRRRTGLPVAAYYGYKEQP